MRVFILSVPRSGSRFMAYFIGEVLGVEMGFSHFWERQTELIQRLIDMDIVLVVPVRDPAELAESYRIHRRSKDVMPMLHECCAVRDRFMPQLEGRAHFINIEKSEKTEWQIDRLLEDIGIPWTQEVTKFVDEWKPVGSQHEQPDERHERAVELMTGWS